MTDHDGPAGPNPSDPMPPYAEPAPESAPPPDVPPWERPPPWAAGAASQQPVPDAADDVADDADDPANGRRGAHRADSAWQRYRARRSAKKQERATRPHKKAPWWELPLLVVAAILIAIVVKTFVVQPFYIPSESMEHTLHGCRGCHGDRILVNKLIYDFRDPHPGDIVVFHAPPGWDDEPTPKPPSNPVLRTIRGFGQLVGVVPPDGQVLVKRVIATGGQTVKGDSQGHVMISTHGAGGPYRTLNEPFVWFNSGQAIALPFGPITVPKDRLWVMGDNRNNSKDSRYHCDVEENTSADVSGCNAELATVPVNDVIGKAFVIAWPPSRWRTLGTPSTFKSAALAGASGIPGMVATSVVLPIFVLRRRRRR